MQFAVPSFISLPPLCSIDDDASTLLSTIEARPGLGLAFVPVQKPAQAGEARTPSGKRDGR